MSEISVPVSPGELIDKITILRIKSQRITDAATVCVPQGNGPSVTSLTTVLERVTVARR